MRTFSGIPGVAKLAAFCSGEVAYAPVVVGMPVVLQPRGALPVMPTRRTRRVTIPRSAPPVRTRGWIPSY